MTCTYAWNDRQVTKTFTGFVSGAGFIDSAEAVSADRRFDDLRVIYNDFSGISGHSVQASDYARVETCRRGAMNTNANYRVAFITAGEDAAKFSEAIRPADHATPFFPQVCASMAAAEAWFSKQAPLDVPRGTAWFLASRAS